MPVTIGFQGLCAIVSEKENVASSASLDVLLVDTTKAKLPCPHDPHIIFPAKSLANPSKLIDPKSNVLSLAGRQVRFLPVGPKAAATGFKEAATLNKVPEMKKACGIGTVDADCFATPPANKPIAGRIQLPPGGQLAPGSLSPDVWSFAPKVGTDCYNNKFALQVLYTLPAAQSFTIVVENLDGTSLGQLTLTGSSGRLAVNNVCILDPAGAPSDDTLVYYQLLDPPFSGAERPKTWLSPDCTIPHAASPGIGCVPFLMSRI